LKAGSRQRRNQKPVPACLLGLEKFLTINQIVRSDAMSEAAMTSKGQVTIPADIRKALGLVAGERVVFTQLDGGSTVMRAKTRSMGEIKGLLKSAGNKRKVSLDDMRIGQR
jgi:AbrB family looped-hinge helix DNA binding protein